jgi:hypothetical protein
VAFLKLRDYWTLKTLEVLGNKKHEYECKDSASPTGKSLLTRVAASHAGIVNGNARFYRPDRMQEGISTWVPKGGYAKPVLLHHDEHGEVLGRVQQAKYVDESYQYNTEFPILRDMQFYRTDSKKKNLFETVDWIVDNLQPLDGYKGLGYTELGLNITNPDAITRILRDEYLTVSVGLTSDAFICSICHTDWAVDDKCDHHMGDIVDGKRVYMICGHLGYDEVSFVNHPADPFAGKIGKAELQDSLSKIFFLGLPLEKQAGLGISMTDSLYESDIHFEAAMENSIFDFTNADSRKTILDEIKNPALTRERALEIKQAISEWKPEAEDEKTSKRSLQSTVSAKISVNGWSKEIPVVDEATAAAADAERAEMQNVLEPPAAADTSAPAVTDAQAAPPAADAAAAVPAVEAPKATDAKNNFFAQLVTDYPSMKDEVAKMTATDEEKKVDYSKALKAVEDLLSAYGALDAENAYPVRALVGAMLEKWYSDGAFEYYKSRLAGSDSVVLLKADVAVQEEAINKLTSQVDDLTQKCAAADAKSLAAFRLYKSGLALQIVTDRVVRKVEGFVDLTDEQFQAKVSELSARTTDSLKDTVKDIRLERRTPIVDAALDPAGTANEPAHQVNDSAKVSEPAPPSGDAAAQTAVDAKAAHEALLAQVAGMTRPERERFLRDLQFADVKRKTSK